MRGFFLFLVGNTSRKLEGLNTIHVDAGYTEIGGNDDVGDHLNVISYNVLKRLIWIGDQIR